MDISISVTNCQSLKNTRVQIVALTITNVNNKDYVLKV